MAHPGRADDADAAADVAGVRGVGGGRVGVGGAEALAVGEGVLPREQDHREGVLRDRQGVGGHRAGDGDPALPQFLADQRTDRARGVQDRAQPGCRGEDSRRRGRGSPSR